MPLDKDFTKRTVFCNITKRTVQTGIFFAISFGDLTDLSIKWVVDEIIVTGPVNEVFPTHDDVAVHSGINICFQCSLLVDKHK